MTLPPTKNFLYFFLALLILGLVLFSFMNRESPIELQRVSGEIEFVEIADQKIKVEVVRSPQARAQGLSGRPSLLPEEGMLFIFPESGQHSFWMKDMLFPIDIIWIDEDKKIVYIKENALPESYPESFAPPNEETSKYVLEVSSGFSLKYGLHIGDLVSF